MGRGGEVLKLKLFRDRATELQQPGAVIDGPSGHFRLMG